MTERADMLRVQSLSCEHGRRQISCPECHAAAVVGERDATIAGLKLELERVRNENKWLKAKMVREGR